MGWDWLIVILFVAVGVALAIRPSNPYDDYEYETVSSITAQCEKDGCTAEETQWILEGYEDYYGVSLEP